MLDSRVAVVLLAGWLAVPAIAQSVPSRVDGISATAVAARARALDELFERGLSRQGQRRNARADDAVFARRIHLDLIGRIPTADELEAFLADRSPHRRAKLIDALLDSPGYVSHTTNWFADLLRAKSRVAPQVSGEPYLHWIAAAVEDNEPYDAFVRALLTAEGPAHQRGNGATGYLMRDREMPQDNMANTVRVFLGTRLECAQCHDHPFDVWTQRQFFEMAAFTGGIEYRYTGDAEERRRLRELLGAVRDAGDENSLRGFRLMLRRPAAGIQNLGTGAIQLPDDYKYDDAEPGEWVVSHTMFGSSPMLEPRLPGQDRGNRRRRERPRTPDIGSRQAFADWLTSPDNPRFTLVIANRMWQRVMGAGLIEPVDAITADTVAANPELMDALVELMIEVDYDLVQFLRVLCNSEFYQASAARIAPEPETAFSAPGPLLRRMSAEQMWDSMLTLVVEDIDSRLRPLGERAERVYREYEEFAAMDEAGALALAEELSLRYRDPEAFRRQQRAERRERAAESRAEAAPLGALRRELARAARAGDQDRVAELEARIAAALGDRQADRGLRRASDLPSPAPADHLLRAFGQSDRELIDGAHRDANVPQVLTLMNGFVDQQIVRGDSYLARRLAASEGATAKVRLAWLSILGRTPTRAELAAWREAVAEPEGLRDLVWILLNTNEFRFVQ